MTDGTKARVGFHRDRGHGPLPPRRHARPADTAVEAVCEPNVTAWAAAAETFGQRGRDTGAHMLDTVADLAGEDFSEVAAWLEDDGRPVDIRAAVIARLTSGALVTMNACGSAIEIQRSGASRLRKVRSVAGVHVWEQFLDVRAGRIPNPSPPEIGLRMARLWDAIRASAARGGAVVRLPAADTGDGPPASADLAGAAR